MLKTAMRSMEDYSISTARLNTQSEPNPLYGGLILRFAQLEEFFEFPIDEANYKLISSFFDSSPEMQLQCWLSIETMDNWILLVNLETLTSIETYKDSTRKAPEFENSEVYKALSSQLEIETQSLSEDLLKLCNEKTEEFEKGNSYSIWNYFNEMNIYTCKGLRHKVFLDRFNAEQVHKFLLFLDEFDDNKLRYLRFGNEDNQGIQVLNVEHIALLQIPRESYRVALAE